MRIFIPFVFFTALLSSASSEEWVSRSGACYELEARWDMNQDASGVWIGVVDFAHVGGPCAAVTKHEFSNEARAVIAGEDFFARLATGSSICYMYGTVRNDEVRGWDLCNFVQGARAFTVRLSPSLEEPRRRQR